MNSIISIEINTKTTLKYEINFLVRLLIYPLIISAPQLKHFAGSVVNLLLQNPHTESSLICLPFIKTPISLLCIKFITLANELIKTISSIDG